MRKLFFILLIFITSLFCQKPTADEILKQVDENMVMDEAISQTKMIIHGRTRSRTITSKSWIKGEEKALVEYLSPPREQGKKMLKTEDKIWIYTPEPTDRIITISGHLLRQSVMGSDLSYEDITDNSSLLENYEATLLEDEKVMDRNCWVMELVAKTEDVSYHRRKIWVDKERYLPIQEKRYAKSGKLLKTTTITEAFQQDGQWIPKHMRFKDELSKGKGTEYIIESIEFDVDIPEYYFTKAGLKR